MKNLIIRINHHCEKFKIVGLDRHSDLSPGRKFDPGTGFDWGYLLENVKL